MPTIFDYLPIIRAQLFIKSLFVCNFVTWSRTKERFVPIFWNNVKHTLPLVINSIKSTLSDIANGESGRFGLCLGLFTQITPTILQTLLVVTWPCAMPHFLRSTFPDCAAKGSEFLWDFGMSEDHKWAVTILDIFAAAYGTNLACVAASFVFHCGVTCVADHLKRCLLNIFTC